MKLLARLATTGAMIAVGLSLIAAPLRADDHPPVADPPLDVGRVSLVDGKLSVTALNNPQWQAASVNYPVSMGEGFFTNSNSRAELELPEGVVRLGSDARLDLEQLDDGGARFVLGHGVFNLKLTSDPHVRVVVDTPRGPVSIETAGSYTIYAEPNGPSPHVFVTTWRGRARVGDVVVPSDSTATLSDQTPYPVLGPARAGDFDQWVHSRDQQLSSYGSAPGYVPPGVAGAQDLNAYGSWVPDPQYGQVWYPQSVSEDWAPYRTGHWAYIVPWGWTWVDDAPWGFVPFHYGRWVLIGDRWAWWPGAPGPGGRWDRRPAYAPALVAFVGGRNGGLYLSAGERPEGWVPLAPYEPYYPTYHASAAYVVGLNIGVVTGVTINVIAGYHGNGNNWHEMGHDQQYHNAGWASAAPAGGGHPVAYHQAGGFQQHATPQGNAVAPPHSGIAPAGAGGVSGASPHQQGSPVGGGEYQHPAGATPPAVAPTHVAPAGAAVASPHLQGSPVSGGGQPHPAAATPQEVAPTHMAPQGHPEAIHPAAPEHGPAPAPAHEQGRGEGKKLCPNGQSTC